MGFWSEFKEGLSSIEDAVRDPVTLIVAGVQALHG